MSQVFPKKLDGVLRIGCFITALMFLFVLLTLIGLTRSSWVTGENRFTEQPIPFSHRHHAGELQIDCRYCHTSVETSAQAGLPPTETCMTCHSQLYTQDEVTAPIRRSWTEDKPIRWKRVIELPDFVYFAHNVHVNNGVACTECHGRVDRMPLMSQAHHYTMGWCLECHKDPARRLRPEEEVFSPEWSPPDHQQREEIAEFLMKKYDVELSRLTECSSCHR